MRLIVDLGQILEVEMRINLRAGDARVAEHFLNCAQITRRLKQMRSERMAQHVRVHVAPETALDCPVRETLFDRTRRDAAPDFTRNNTPSAINEARSIRWLLAAGYSAPW